MMKCSIRMTTKMHEIRSTIENVSKLKEDTIVTGPDFYLACECLCCISFKKSDTNLFVYICNKSATEIKIVRKLLLYDCNNIKLHEENEINFSLKKDQDTDVIGRVPNRTRFDTLTNDTLIIDLWVNIKEVIGIKINCFKCDTEPGRKMREDFKTMLENPVNSDVSLQVGDERIPAHWSILCSRSPYFKKMFDSGMRERVQNSVTIADLSLDTVKKLIQFLYTADFVEKDDLKELFDLYYAADKCEVLDLRHLCACKIINNATADNVCQILQLAHCHNDKRLKMEAMDFIRSHSNAVFQTEGWEKFKVSEPLAAEFCSFFCMKEN
ncbi:Speckle-type POZ protein B [Araneus ventricosus]|uniref:Speckle-type POZ protein B n=1 Tax=Araneus ventricosus TaxID=182803 RepID=A0A4Y2DFV5_ARAVE|nr:Speckle-type POZ protein B [Araneus ventricosus]